MKNIIETATSNPEFSILADAIKAAGLVETLSGVGPFTVFAPNNAAFAKIPEATLKSLLADKAKLASVLTYHVVSGKISPKDFVTMTETKTVEGSKITIDTKKVVMINNAILLAGGIECSNGVIHVIDTVLMP